MEEKNLSLDEFDGELIGEEREDYDDRDESDYDEEEY